MVLRFETITSDGLRLMSRASCSRLGTEPEAAPGKQKEHCEPSENHRNQTLTHKPKTIPSRLAL